MTRGERLATFFTLLFHHECGAFGGEDPILEDNTMTLYSQMGEQVYTFNDDDSVDVIMCDDSEVHYEHVRDLLYSDDDWFMYIEPEIVEKVLEDYI
jgi:hypothetical protein